MALLNKSFETVGSSPGLAANWTVTIIANGKRLYDFGASNGDPPKPIEDFERGWGCDNFLFAFPYVGFVSANTAAVLFDAGTNPIESFESWTPGFSFYLTTTFSPNFSGAGQAGIETFDTGWGCDQPLFALVPALSVTYSADQTTSVFTCLLHPFTNGMVVEIPSGPPSPLIAATPYVCVNVTPNTVMLAASPSGPPIQLSDSGSGTIVHNADSTAVTFADGIDTETFGDTQIASVTSSVFTVSATPDDGTPIAFRSPAPSGLTAGTTYWILSLSPTTFSVSGNLGGSPITVGNGSGLVFDVVYPRLELPSADMAGFTFGAPSGSPAVESFENVRGTFSFVVDPSTDIFTVADHPFLSGDQIQFAGPGLPSAATAIAAGITFFARDITTSTFRIAATSGGTAIDITSVAGTGATVFGDPSQYFNNLAA
jgi:hypothetical protein